MSVYSYMLKTNNKKEKTHPDSWRNIHAGTQMDRRTVEEEGWKAEGQMDGWTDTRHTERDR